VSAQHIWLRTSGACIGGRARLATLAGLATLVAGCSAISGPSESYAWGERAGNTAVSFEKSGMTPESACQEAIVAGAMWADKPALNPSPPPKNFDRSDGQKGCLHKLHELLG
jgi:hypothetical protein